MYDYTEADEIVDNMDRTFPTLCEARDFVRSQMPDETEQGIDNIAQELVRPPYCYPAYTGLQSTDRAVCKRLARLLDSLSTEINAFVVEGEIAEDARAFRLNLIGKLKADGWTMSYDGGDRLKVRQPGHKRPFKNHG